LTIDETIQYFAEKAAQQALLDNKAKNVSIIMMEPKTGDIIAMASKPDFDPNNPRQPMDENLKKEWSNLPVDQLTNKWYELWRNFAVSDIYEPGSTFKIITTAAALEEGTTSLNSHYYCNGYIRDIKGALLKCVRYYNPHGDQTLSESLNNSCNVAFVNIARELGKEKFYKYIKGFGFGEKTNIDLLGEQPGIIPGNLDMIKEVNLATMSYGHGIAITPIQLTTALSAISNGGNLMKPQIGKRGN
jgi:stage V sporulation protein D (sporulation-specific penicillin-binding protein)